MFSTLSLGHTLIPDLVFVNLFMHSRIGMILLYLPTPFDTPKVFLNQVRASRRPARAWFLKIDPVRIVGMRVCVCVCVCVSAPEATNN